MRINKVCKWLIYIWTIIVYGFGILIALVGVGKGDIALAFGSFILYCMITFGIWLVPTIVLLIIGMLVNYPNQKSYDFWKGLIATLSQFMRNALSFPYPASTTKLAPEPKS